MDNYNNRSRYIPLLISMIICSLIGASMAGLIESIVITISSGYTRLILPVTAVFYYGITGIVIAKKDRHKTSNMSGGDVMKNVENRSGSGKEKKKYKQQSE